MRLLWRIKLSKNWRYGALLTFSIKELKTNISSKQICGRPWRISTFVFRSKFIEWSLHSMNLKALLKVEALVLTDTSSVRLHRLNQVYVDALPTVFIAYGRRLEISRLFS